MEFLKWKKERWKSLGVPEVEKERWKGLGVPEVEKREMEIHT